MIGMIQKDSDMKMINTRTQAPKPNPPRPHGKPVKQNHRNPPARVTSHLTHARERIQDRLGLPASAADLIQQRADKSWFGYARHKLATSDSTLFHVRLLGNGNTHLGYATFEKVGLPKNNRLVLTTVLRPDTHPRGTDIGKLLDPQLDGISLPTEPVTAQNAKH